MWLWLSLTALLCWSGSDLFSKIGCRDGSDRYSHLKMVIAVGVGIKWYTDVNIGCFDVADISAILTNFVSIISSVPEYG